VSNPSYRVLVTGSLGFVGRYLLTALAAALPNDAEIIATTNTTGDSFECGKVRIAELDVTSAEQVRAAIMSSRPTHVFHLAAIAAIPAAQQDIRQTWQVNFGGTFNVALAIQENAPDCRMIYCSSALVYGGSSSSDRPIDEDAPLNPDNAYGASKAAADIMIGQMAKHGLRALRLRPFNHTGPGQSEDFVVPAFAAQIARIERGQQEPVMYVGGLDDRRDFLDVRDVVDAYVKAVLRFDELPHRCVINIASGCGWPIRTVLDSLLALSPKTIKVVQDEQRMRSTESSTVIGSCQIARELLDWSPRFEFSTTLSAVLDHWRRL
jgi:GDP-4-dehydro-6-deoxy-D-mannose reductase